MLRYYFLHFIFAGRVFQRPEHPATARLAARAPLPVALLLFIIKIVHEIQI